jgi:hypothetical protein
MSEGVVCMSEFDSKINYSAYLAVKIYAKKHF